MKVSIIAAHDPNLVIGKDGGLPWHYKEDLQFFKKTTMGLPILMGRGVFEELSEKPLPGRENVILSRSKKYEHVKTCTSIEDAFHYLSEEERIFIIGGGDIYQQTLDKTDELIITEVHKEYNGDTFFPEYRDEIGTTWQEIWREDHKEFSFIKYKRM